MKRVSLNKLDYLLGVAARRALGMGRNCPSCGSMQSDLESSKYLVTQLRRCAACKLLFRTPTTSRGENDSFYQRRYTQGFTTDLPDDKVLKGYMSSGFAGSEKDYSRIRAILEALAVPKSARLFDFGCSWGYGSWQLARAGYAVESYEVSVPRAEYAREKLGCTVHEELSTVTSGFDVFFSSHVLEHVPSVRSVLDFGFSILRTGGIFVALTPNGSALHRSKDPEGWQHSWGQVHPNLLDDVYYRHVLKDRSFILTADPYDAAALSRWVGAQHNQTALDLSGGELLCAARA